MSKNQLEHIGYFCMCITVKPTIIALKLNISQNKLKDLEAAEY